MATLHVTQRHSKQRTKYFLEVRRQKEIDKEQLHQELLKKDKVGFIHEIQNRNLSNSATPSDLSVILKDDTLFICVQVVLYVYVINVAAITVRYKFSKI